MPARKTKKKRLPVISSDELRKNLKVKHLRTKAALSEAHPKAAKFLADQGLDLSRIREHSGKIIGTGLVAGALLAQVPNSADTLPSPSDMLREAKYVEESKDKQKNNSIESSRESLTSVLKSTLPEQTRPLYRNEEKFLEFVLLDLTGIKAKASLEGEHLNTTYGKIGIEQHLRRYPGDRLSEHGSTKDQKEGMAPGLGAWGYFAPTKEALTPDLIEKEKWYAVVQTMYLPGWNTRQPHLKNWYKYRKVLIVNTENGKVVVAAIADSGPAAWTGKHFGGSPEVMDYLGGDIYKKGPVLMFFVDDPDNRVPLGPVEY